MGGSIPSEAAARVGFILVAFGLVSYVAAVISREQRRASEAALALSRIDPLTGLFSRLHFERALELEILRVARTGRGFSMLLLDLDALKRVNDNFGHDAGDRLLGSIGEVMRGGVRATDVAARLGGDEFVVILPETDLAGALLVAEKLRRDIGHLAVPTNGNLVSSSVSVGVVFFPDDARTKEELLRRADRAMYEAKRRGKNQIVNYPRPVSPSAPVETEPTSVMVDAEPQPAAAMEQPRAPQNNRPEIVVTDDVPWGAGSSKRGEGDPNVVVRGEAPWE
jgi:diguanylate cyclase (GGDEF)-like protein